MTRDHFGREAREKYANSPIYVASIEYKVEKAIEDKTKKFFTIPRRFYAGKGTPPKLAGITKQYPNPHI